jgi:hypothetical protein
VDCRIGDQAIVRPRLGGYSYATNKIAGFRASCSDSIRGGFGRIRPALATRKCIKLLRLRLAMPEVRVVGWCGLQSVGLVGECFAVGCLSDLLDCCEALVPSGRDLCHLSLGLSDALVAYGEACFTAGASRP